MLTVKTRRVIVAEYRIDFRKRFDGLLGEAYRLGADPYQGDCVLFIKRDMTQVRAIVGDSVGLYLICRRLDAGGLKGLIRFMQDPHVREISIGELSLLLEGTSYSIRERARPWRKQSS